MERYQLNVIEVKRPNLTSSRQVSIDEITLNIFFTVSVGGIIHVCNIQGDYLYHFGSKSPRTNLSSPWYNCISDQLLYATDYSTGKVSIYTLEGNLITCFNSFGKNTFKRPNGILVDQRDGGLYICDTITKVVQATSDCISVKSYGIGILRNPHAIRLNEDTLFVLDQSKIEMFSLNGQYQGKISLEDKFSSFYFEIGEGNEILICDDRAQLYILDSKGKVIHCYEDNKETDSLYSKLPCIVKQPNAEIITFRIQGKH